MLKLVHLSADRKKNCGLAKRYLSCLKPIQGRWEIRKIRKLNSLLQTKVIANKSKEVGTIAGNNIKTCEKPFSSGSS